MQITQQNATKRSRKEPKRPALVPSNAVTARKVLTTRKSGRTSIWTKSKWKTAKLLERSSLRQPSKAFLSLRTSYLSCTNRKSRSSRNLRTNGSSNIPSLIQGTKDPKLRSPSFSKRSQTTKALKWLSSSRRTASSRLSASTSRR